MATATVRRSKNKNDPGESLRHVDVYARADHHVVMAKTTITQISDDIDGTGDAQEIAFSFGGTDYVIDLAKKNATAFEKALKPYISAATVVTTRSSRSAKNTSRRPSGRKSSTDLAAVRAWAKESGIDVSERGRVAQSVLDQYRDAHTK
jgi:hypothetical protein